MTHGIVIDSNNFHPITAGELRSCRAKALLCNGTEGTQFVNPIIAEQHAAAKAAGVPFGTYLFLHPDSKGSEAAFYLDHCRPQKGEFPPIIDAEVTNLGLSELAHRVHSCAGALEHEGFEPILYAGYEVWNACVAQYPGLKRLKVWFPQYPGRFASWKSRYLRLRIRLRGAHVVMWQFTDVFAVHGKTFDASVLLVPLRDLLIR